MSIMEFVVLYVSMGFIGIPVFNAIFIDLQTVWIEKYGYVPNVAYFIFKRKRFRTMIYVALCDLFYPVYLTAASVKLIMASWKLHH